MKLFSVTSSTSKHIKRSPAEVRREQRRKEERERVAAANWADVQTRYGNWFRPDAMSEDAKGRKKFFDITRNTKIAREEYDEPLAITVARVMARRLWINSAPPTVRQRFVSDPGYQAELIKHVMTRLHRYADLSVIYDESPLPQCINWEPKHIGGNFFLTKEKISLPLKYYVYFATNDCPAEILAEWSGVPVDKQEELLKRFTEFLSEELTDESNLTEEYGKPYVAVNSQIGNLYFTNATVDTVTVNNNYAPPVQPAEAGK